ncbi:MAG: sugar ABC transporter substrate-binding protein, partial [Spirochaetia bacterium]|nr:sugar ABC transporter substrate-binding protein [Spirochaetia bacterium]
AVAGGSQEAETVSGKETVVWQNFLSAEKAFAPVIDEMIGLFESKNEGVEIEIVELPYEQTLQQTIISASADSMADVVLLVPQWVPPLVELNSLEPLDSYFSSSDLADIPNAAYDSGVVKGKTYSVPALLNVVLVWAWKPLLEQAGLPPVVPQTWEEFKTASKKVAALGDDVYGFAARTNNTGNSAFWMFPVIWGHGGQFEDGTGKIILDQGEGYGEALSWYRDLVSTGQSPNAQGVRELRNIFAQGQIGFLLDVSTAIGTFRSVSERGTAIDDDIVAGLIPKAADGNRYGIGNDNVYAVSAGSKVKESAAEFIKFMTQDPEATKIFYQKSGAFPTYRSLYDDPDYAAEPFFAEIAEMAEFGTSNPSKNPKFGQALDVMANAMQEAILGGEVDHIVSKTAEQVRDIYGQ